MTKLVIDDLPDPEDRFILEECIGQGVCGKVYKATDTQLRNMKVAIKMQKINRENMQYIQEEYKVLKEMTAHANLPDFYGAYRKVNESDDEVWFVMELCEYGSIHSFVNGVLRKNRRMTEEHIAFVLKETIKALIHLHEHRIMHRDVKASNILITKEGEIKLVDFGLSRRLSSTFGRTDSCIGSPCWMSPEVVLSNIQEDDDNSYGNRADVWALGITAIELGDGKAPFQDMHPTRALFQIVRNPPPTLYRTSNWSELYNDFINECLTKNPEHRPFMVELLEHPFISELSDNTHHLTQELKSIFENACMPIKTESKKEVLVTSSFLKHSIDANLEKMSVEDLAALDRLSEDSVIKELQYRMQHKMFQTYIGDVLLVLNPNEKQDIYGGRYHQKYTFKSRSDNAPHIYAMADSAYQEALHHLVPQNILLSGESGSGKTTNFLHLIDHLLHLGQNSYVSSERILDAVKLIHAMTHASTPQNDYSTRCILKTELIFGSTGKVSAAYFTMNLLEKWRVSSVEMAHSNYHILYYLYDGLEASNQLDIYKLRSGRDYRYLRISDECKSKKQPRDNPQENVRKFDKIKEIFETYDFQENQIETILQVLASILVLGDVRFQESEEGRAKIETENEVGKVAELLEIEEKKLSWALTNYCLSRKGAVVRRQHNCDEARDARDALANTIYCRVVDYVVNVINEKLSYGKSLFGDKYSVRVLDICGFECFKSNHLPQLFINCLNEQLHYHYLQRVFAWEALEMNEEEVPYTHIHYYDNKETLDEILNKPEGVMILIDDASKMGNGGGYVIDYLKSPERKHVEVQGTMQFSIRHYTGKVTYNAKEMPDRNRDFLPPEVIETIRLSGNKIIKSLFTNKLTRRGNLSVSIDNDDVPYKSSSDEEKVNKTSEPQYSQIKKMRTAVTTFRSLCLDILRELSIGGGAGGTHFVRCMRSDLEGKPLGFHPEIVKQQLKALAVLDTARAKQKGYPHRISFSEFLRRYKFLAFDFDENVEVSRENCRLLLVRLKMEGWIIGKTKVFLRYYNEEYLSRLYETQVKKIIKIQSIMRVFLTKARLKAKNEKSKQKSLVVQSEEDLEEERAARVLQKVDSDDGIQEVDTEIDDSEVTYRGVVSRKAYRPLVKEEFESLSEEACKFIRFYCVKWKAKSIFQVLLQYRAARFQDLFNFSQQVHLFNQVAVYNLEKTNDCVEFDQIDRQATVSWWLGEAKPSVTKLPFRLDEIPFFDTSYMCDPLTNLGVAMEENEDWDAPLRWRATVSSQITTSLQKDEADNTQQLYSNTSNKLVHLPYNRDPNEPVRRLSSVFEESSNCEDLKALTSSRASSPKPPVQTPVVDSKYNTDNANVNSKPANKDFEYIKPLSKQKAMIPNTVNPISEMKDLCKRNTGNDDDPPFNFQAMLRKTSVKRESIKKTMEQMRKLNRKGVENDGNYISTNRGNLRKYKSVDSVDKERVQLVPGIYIEGIVSDV